MGKIVTAVAALFVAAVAAVLVINSGILDMTFGEGEADAGYEITNKMPGTIEVTFDDGLNGPQTFSIGSGETYTVDSIHYEWDNRMPLVLTVHCQFDYGSTCVHLDSTTPVKLDHGSDVVIPITLDLNLLGSLI